MEKDDAKKVIEDGKKLKKKTTKKVKDLNETVKKTVKKDVDKVIKEVKDAAVNEVQDLTNTQKCKYCGKYFDKGMTICPNCRRRNKRNSMDILFFVMIGVVFLFLILLFYFVNTHIISKETYESYTQKCTFVSYEDLVRIPKTYLDKDVTVVGQVVKVEGYNDGLYNNMDITLDLNLFEDGSESLVTVHFEDRSYEKGFIDGDIVKIYGEYSTISGNKPVIMAKYIDLNN